MLIKQMIKNCLRKLAPGYFEKRDVTGEFKQFGECYYRNASIKDDHTAPYICNELRIQTHVIEKALSLPNVKMGFGKGKIAGICTLLHEYEEYADKNYDPEAYENGIKILKTYAANADRYNLDISEIDPKYLENGPESDLGVRILSSWEISEERVRTLPFDRFAEIRHSYRDFRVRGGLTDELLENIVRLAQTAPSACNRQDVRVICVREPAKVQKLMEMHPGARGFATPACVFLVASDLKQYGKFEMSLPYFDGGLFTMNLLYALEYYGLGACPLIWEDYCNGERLREIVDLPESLVVNIFIPAGFLPEHPVAAVSKRRPVSDVLRII